MSIERANGPAHTGSRLQRSIGAHVPLFKTLRVSEHVEHAGPHHGCGPANAFVFFLAIEATLFPSLRRHPDPPLNPPRSPTLPNPALRTPSPSLAKVFRLSSADDGTTNRIVPGSSEVVKASVSFLHLCPLIPADYQVN
jgi:hypothetical protein